MLNKITIRQAQKNLAFIIFPPKLRSNKDPARHYQIPNALYIHNITAKGKNPLKNEK